MKKFKYSLTLRGRTKIKIDFSHELKILGYKIGNDFDTNTNELSVGSPLGKDFSDDQYNFQSGSMKRDYEFNIDETWQFEAALAIAAIRNDTLPHVGEWVYMPDHQTLSYSGEEYARINYVDDKGNTFNTKEQSQQRDSLLHGSYGITKATPEQLMKFFKQKYQALEMEKRKIIGYRIIKDGPGFKKGDELTEEVNLDGNVFWKKPKEDKRLGIKFPDFITKDTEWFEPIHEEAIKRQKIAVGSRNLEIQITSEKEIKVTSYNTVVIPESIEVILAALDNFRNLQITNEGHAVYISEDVRFLRIGCQIDNNLFSCNELKAVVDVYKKLNP